MDGSSDSTVQPTSSPPDILPPPKPVNILIFIFGGLIILSIGLFGGYYLIKSTSTPPQKACTMEAKLCPDGSSISRTDPNCEFAPCLPIRTTSSPIPDLYTKASRSTMVDWKTYRNDELEYSFSYPSNWRLDIVNPAKIYILGNSAKIEIIITSEKQRKLYPRGPDIMLPCQGVESIHQTKNMNIGGFTANYSLGNLGCWEQHNKIRIFINRNDGPPNYRDNITVISYAEYNYDKKNWLQVNEWRESQFFDQILSTFKFL